VPEGMPADPAQPHLLRCGDEPVLLDFTGPVRLSCIRICKDPVLFVRRRSTPQLMLSQLLRQRRVKWHPSLRSRRFDSARLSVNIGLAYAYSHAFPIDVTPLQPSISLTRSPKHIATMHIVRNGSGMCSNICRNSSTERTLGSRIRFEPSFTRTRLMGLS
jgi:hypothetical protein